MKKWYGVQSCYYDNGKVMAAIMDVVEQEKKPEATFKELRRCDCYMEWFGSEKEAKAYIEECQMA